MSNIDDLMIPGQGVTLFGNNREETKRNLKYALGSAKLKSARSFKNSYLIIDSDGLYLKSLALHDEVRNVEFTPDQRQALKFSENAAFGVETLLTYAFNLVCRAEEVPMVALLSSLNGRFVKSLHGGEIQTTKSLDDAEEFTETEAAELLKTVPALRLSYVTYRLRGRGRLPTKVYIK